MKSMCSFGFFSFPPRVHTLLSGGLDWALHSGSSSLPAWRCKRLEWLSNRMTVECSTRRYWNSWAIGWRSNVAPDAHVQHAIFQMIIQSDLWVEDSCILNIVLHLVWLFISSILCCSLLYSSRDGCRCWAGSCRPIFGIGRFVCVGCF